MTAEIRDPERRSRLARALLISMLLSSTCGALNLAGWATHNRPQRWTWELLKSALPLPIGYTAVTFWILFAILFFCHVRRSVSTLEYQQRIQLDEDRLEQAKGRPDTPAGPAAGP